MTDPTPVEHIVHAEVVKFIEEQFRLHPVQPVTFINECVSSPVTAQDLIAAVQQVTVIPTPPCGTPDHPHVVGPHSKGWVMCAHCARPVWCGD